MHTVILNGSPRKNGDTAFIINLITKKLNGTFSVIDTFKSDVQPCSDCRLCYENNFCRINDYMKEYREEIENCDNIIIASPLYFSMLTGSILNFVSRFQFYYVSKYIRKDKHIKVKNKNGYLVLVGGGATKDTAAVVKTSKLIFMQINAVFKDVFEYINTDSVSANDCLELSGKVDEFVDKINK